MRRRNLQNTIMILCTHHQQSQALQIAVQDPHSECPVEGQFLWPGISDCCGGEGTEEGVKRITNTAFQTRKEGVTNLEDNSPSQQGFPCNVSSCNTEPKPVPTNTARSASSIQRSTKGLAHIHHWWVWVWVDARGWVGVGVFCEGEHLRPHPNWVRYCETVVLREGIAGTVPLRSLKLSNSASDLLSISAVSSCCKISRLQRKSNISSPGNTRNMD